MFPKCLSVFILSSEITIIIHLYVVFLCSSNIMTPSLDTGVEIESKIKLLSHLIKSSTNSKVISKNSKEEFDKAREVHNGLCKNIVPSVIVMPTSTNDVSKVIKIVRKFNVPISIRSGGHSYICSNIKQGRKFIMLFVDIVLDIFSVQFYDILIQYLSNQMVFIST